MRNRWKIFFSCSAVLALNACGSVKAYNGSTKPKSELAFIDREAFLEWVFDNDQSIEMIEVNGYPVRKSKVWIEPGNCVIKVEFSDEHEGNQLFSRSPASINFQAEAGQSYYLASSVDYEKKTWSIWINGGAIKTSDGNLTPRKVSEIVTTQYQIKENPRNSR